MPVAELLATVAVKVMLAPATGVALEETTVVVVAINDGAAAVPVI